MALLFIPPQFAGRHPGGATGRLTGAHCHHWVSHRPPFWRRWGQWWSLLWLHKDGRTNSSTNGSLREDKTGSASYREKHKHLTSSLRKSWHGDNTNQGLKLQTTVWNCGKFQPLLQLHYQKWFVTRDIAQNSEKLFSLQQVNSLPLYVNHLGFMLCMALWMHVEYSLFHLEFKLMLLIMQSVN